MKLHEIIDWDQNYYLNCYGQRQKVCFSHGKGLKLWDLDGKEYIDFLSGISVNSLGHSHPNLVNALKKQAEKYIHCSNLYYIEQQAILAKKLSELSCFDKFFFGNSGAEANEAALKFVRLYYKKIGLTDRYEIITLTNSFHGRTLATLTATGQPKYHSNFRPLPPGFIYVPINDYDQLKTAITKNTCAIMLEPLQGEGGINLVTQEYLNNIKDICKANNILLIFDEIQTGIGRTGKMFCYEHFNIEPDIMTLAKGIGGGFPIGALCIKNKIAEVIEPGDHGSTFGGNPFACSAALAVLDTIEEEKLVLNANNIGKYFWNKLITLKNEYPIISDIRGNGLLLGIEFCQDIAQNIKNELFAQGYLIGSIGPKIIRLAPPLIVTHGYIDDFLTAFKKVLITKNF